MTNHDRGPEWDIAVGPTGGYSTTKGWIIGIVALVAAVGVLYLAWSGGNDYSASKDKPQPNTTTTGSGTSTPAPAPNR